jgi:hypothetical protein
VLRSCRGLQGRGVGGSSRAIACVLQSVLKGVCGLCSAGVASMAKGV